MSDLVVSARAGWIELEVPFGGRGMVPLTEVDWDDLWGRLGQGDDAGAREVLDDGGVFFAQPGSHGEQGFQGKLELRAVTTPDDMNGESRRVWFRASGPVEVWSLERDERIQER